MTDVSALRKTRLVFKKLTDAAPLAMAKANKDFQMTLDLAQKYPHLGAIMTNEPPMRRMGDRTDLKGLIVYLLSDASAYTTSEDHLVTGGIHAGRLL